MILLHFASCQKSGAIIIWCLPGLRPLCLWFPTPKQKLGGFYCLVIDYLELFSISGRCCLATQKFPLIACLASTFLQLRKSHFNQDATTLNTPQLLFV
jgi:hypothetical protein